MQLCFKSHFDYISIADPGRIYIKGYLYPISYPKIGWDILKDIIS
jgi:hypothetical protein